MLSVADRRAFFSPDERYQHCAFCGKEIVVLPNDRRGGACYDCLSLLGPEPAPCPQCGAEISADERTSGCAQCGWYPIRD